MVSLINTQNRASGRKQDYHGDRYFWVNLQSTNLKKVTQICIIELEYHV